MSQEKVVEQIKTDMSLLQSYFYAYTHLVIFVSTPLDFQPQTCSCL